MADTKIEWCDKTWNPVSGCTRVSEGCRHCWAERMSKRLAGRAGYPEDGFKVTLHPDKLDEPLRWKKPARIFVCSMGDLFHEDVPDEFILSVFETIARAEQHTFMILTKRPDRMLDFMEYTPPPIDYSHLLLGASIENQPTADKRIGDLLGIRRFYPLIKLFVSYEPALGPVDFTKIRYTNKTHLDVLRGWEYYSAADVRINKDHPKLDWVIMGGESGPGARPLHPDWPRTVRDQCQAAGVPFFFKQWGEWAVVDKNKQDEYLSQHPTPSSAKVVAMVDERFTSLATGRWGNKCQLMHRVGKKAAGCLLDGKEHKERP